MNLSNASSFLASEVNISKPRFPHTNHMISNKNSFYHLSIHNSLKGSLFGCLTLTTKYLMKTKENVISCGHRLVSML